ncbi:MAG: cell division protein FtsQ/DivIB [Gammaproteobacteria bacterium]
MPKRNTRQPRPGLRQLLTAVRQHHIRTVSGMVLLGMLGTALYLGTQWLSDPYRFPLRVVKVEGEFRYLDRDRLQTALAPLIEGGFFTADVAGIRSAAEQLAWVERAAVTRVWPDILRVYIEEQVPVAHWGEAGLLNASGEVFQPASAGALAGLPWLAGPQGLADRVLESYQQITRVLDSLGLQMTRLELDERRAWHLQLDGGVRLELGRVDSRQRLQRFVQAYPQLFAGRMNELQRVDMRYSNGFSVHWHRVALDDAPGKQG